MAEPERCSRPPLITFTTASVSTDQGLRTLGNGLNEDKIVKKNKQKICWKQKMPTATEKNMSENVNNDGNENVFFDENPRQLRIIKVNDQVRRLQTIVRDRTSTRSDFVFSADRLIRLVVEESLNLLPYSNHVVQTPAGHSYNGIKFDKGNCGVSIIRSGEAMEQGLRECCRSIRLGKILIQSDEETNQAKVFYAKLPKDIASRNVLLMYPILSSGNTALKAMEILEEHGVSPKNIILLTLFTTPEGTNAVVSKYPEARILTTEIYPVAPVHFGQKYFGTD